MISLPIAAVERTLTPCPASKEKTVKTIQRMLCMGALVAASFGAAAQTYGPKDEGRRFNDGSKVVCKNVEVQRNSRDPNRIAGTATGAVVGGLLGNQVGGGNGKKLATVAGAVAGGAAGRNIQGRSQQNKGDRVVERRCERQYR
jgi:outer membrane lipoprotein SlyB